MSLMFFLILSGGLLVNILLNSISASNIVALVLALLLALAQLPPLRRLLWSFRSRLTGFLIRAGLVVLACLVLLAVHYFEPAGQQLRDSIKSQQAADKLLQGHSDDAAELLEDVADNGNLTLTGRLNLGSAYRDIGKSDKAMEQYNLVLQENPGSSVAYFNYGLIYLDAEDYPNALNCFNAAANLEPDMWVAYLYAGLINREQKDYRKALCNFQKSDLRMPGQPIVNYNLALCAYNLNDVKMAKSYISQALELEQPEEITGELQQMSTALKTKD